MWAGPWVGCQARPDASPAQHRAAAWIEGLNSRRLDRLAALCVPDVSYEDPLSGGPRSGPALGYYLSVLWQRYPSAQYRVDRATGGDDWVIVEWKASGLSAPAAGELAGVFILKLRDNAIASVRGYFDAGAIPGS